MKNNEQNKMKIFLIIIFIICFGILAFSSIYLYNSWYNVSRNYHYMTKTETDLLEQNNRIAFIYRSFPILIDPFNCEKVYESLVNKNEISQQDFKEYIEQNILSKINVRRCTIDYQLVSQSALKDGVKYNYVAYFYDKDYYANNLIKDIEKAKVKMNVNVITYYPGNYKLEIPIN